MIIKHKRFLILVVILILIDTWSINFNAEGAKNQVPTTTPTGFTATAVSPTQIYLSWIAPTQNYGKIIVGYKIEQRLGNGMYDTIVDNTGSTITTYSMTGLITGVTYTYRVSAVYSDDTSTDPSNPAMATPLITSIPIPTTTPLSSHMANMQFDFVPPDGTVLVGVVISPNDYYGLQYKKDPRSVILNAVSTTQSINNNLDRLISYQIDHISPDSVPAPLIAKSVSPTQIDLSWLPPIETYGQKLVGYKIEQKNAQGDYQVIDDNTGNDMTKFAVTGLTPGSTYTYRVSAVYPPGTHSNPSNEASATTLVPYSQPVQKPNQTIPDSSQSSNTHPPSITPMPQTNNVQLDFTAPDGNLLPGIILTQNDYQQFVIIKDPRTILSNVSQTSATVNNDLAGLIQYQNLHHIQQTVNPPPVNSNSSHPPTITSSPSTDNSVIPNITLLQGIITSVLASLVVGIITWLVKTKVARKIAKEYHFTLEKFSSAGVPQIRINNSGETIEDCVIMCEKDVCVWNDTDIDKPRHIYEGSVSTAKTPEGYENKNPLITVKSGKKILRKIRLDDMAYG